jgi:hypothetical protein
LYPVWGDFLQKNTARNTSAVLVFLKSHNVIGGTVQNGAETFQGVHGDALVMTQIVNGSGADSMFFDERIGGNALGLHGLP